MPPPNLQPACNSENTTSTAETSLPGGHPTGMPRPSSRTVTEPSPPKVTSMRRAWPAAASSTPLSISSHTRCMSPSLPVPPMYMPGRLRTASRPSKVWMESAS